MTKTVTASPAFTMSNREAQTAFEAAQERRKNWRIHKGTDDDSPDLKQTLAMVRAKNKTATIQHGVVRTNDGLAQLRSGEKITEAQFASGMMFQRAYQTINGRNGRDSLDMTPTGSVEGAWQTIIDQGRIVAAFKALCDPATKRQWWVLELVAGQGRSIRSLGGGRSYAVNIAALIIVLDQAERLLDSGNKSRHTTGIIASCD